MNEKKIKLSFVDGGKPFIVPHMTVTKQEEYLEDIVDLNKKINDEKKRNREANKYIVLKTLQIIDKNITIDDINNMHPSDFIILFDMIWTKGKELNGDDENSFREIK